MVIMQENTAFPDLFIVPTDYSSASLNASYFAVELAAKFKARLKFLHTYTCPEYVPAAFEGAEPLIGTTLTEVRNIAEKNLTQFIEKLTSYTIHNNLTEVPVTSQLFNGEPEELTLYISESEKASLIIMGVTSTETRSFEPIGRIASHIIERSKVPVLIIPEESSFSGINKIHNILYTTTFDESDFPAIERLMFIVRKIDMNIFCLHIGESEKPWDRIKMNGLKNYFNEVYGKPNVESDFIFSKNMMQALDEYISTKKIDIMAISSRKRNMLAKYIYPSLTQKILYHTNIPLLVFRA